MGEKVVEYRNSIKARGRDLIQLIDINFILINAEKCDSFRLNRSNSPYGPRVSCLTKALQKFGHLKKNVDF